MTWRRYADGAPVIPEVGNSNVRKFHFQGAVMLTPHAVAPVMALQSAPATAHRLNCACLSHLYFPA